MTRRASSPAPAATVNPTDPDDDDLDIPDAGDLEALAGVGEEWKWAVYRRLRPEEKSMFPGETRVLMTTVEGPINHDTLEWIKREFGGGTYELWGTIRGQRGLRLKPVISLAGEIRPAIPAPPPTTTAAPSSNGNGNGVAEMLRILERIEQRLSAPVTAPVQQGITVKDMLELMPLMQPAREPSAKVQLDGLMDVLKTGIELGTTRDPGEPPDLGMQMLEKALPTLEKVATAILSRAGRPPAPRPATPGAPGDPAARPSEAQVIEQTPEDAERAARLTTLVGALARAIAQGIEVQDFAGTVESILPDDELYALRLYEPDKLMAEIRANTGTRYATLETDQALQYVTELLAELRSPAEVVG